MHALFNSTCCLLQTSLDYGASKKYRVYSILKYTLISYEAEMVKGFKGMFIIFLRLQNLISVRM